VKQQKKWWVGAQRGMIGGLKGLKGETNTTRTLHIND